MRAWILAAALALALAACAGPQGQDARDKTPPKWQPYVSIGVGAGF
jgi:hypothetical protein